MSVHLGTSGNAGECVSVPGSTWDLWCAERHVNKNGSLRSLENMTRGRTSVNDFTMTLRQTRRHGDIEGVGRSESNCGSVDKVKLKRGYLCLSTRLCVSPQHAPLPYSKKKKQPFAT